jgi:hypothetical protein
VLRIGSALAGINWVDPALLEIVVNVTIGVSSIGSHRYRRATTRGCRGIDALNNDLPVIGLAGRHFDVEDYATEIIDDCVPFIKQISRRRFLPLVAIEASAKSC